MIKLLDPSTGEAVSEVKVWGSAIAGKSNKKV